MWRWLACRRIRDFKWIEATTLGWCRSRSTLLRIWSWLSSRWRRAAWWRIVSRERRCKHRLCRASDTKRSEQILSFEILAAAAFRSIEIACEIGFELCSSINRLSLRTSNNLVVDLVNRDHVFMQVSLSEDLVQRIILSLLPFVGVAYTLEIVDVLEAIRVLVFVVFRCNNKVSRIILLRDTCFFDRLVNFGTNSSKDLLWWMPDVLAKAKLIIGYLSLLRDPQSTAILKFSIVPSIIECWVVAIFDDLGS